MLIEWKVDRAKELEHRVIVLALAAKLSRARRRGTIQFDSAGDKVVKSPRTMRKHVLTLLTAIATLAHAAVTPSRAASDVTPNDLASQLRYSTAP
jgi:hypothetical protein